MNLTLEISISACSMSSSLDHKHISEDVELNQLFGSLFIQVFSRQNVCRFPSSVCINEDYQAMTLSPTCFTDGLLCLGSRAGKSFHQFDKGSSLSHCSTKRHGIACGSSLSPSGLPVLRVLLTFTLCFLLLLWRSQRTFVLQSVVQTLDCAAFTQACSGVCLQYLS